MDGNVVNNLCSLPAKDLNFTTELNRATSWQIKQAIETMEQNGGKNKGRIKACERELENRRLTKKGKDGKYVSKEHLSILCNTFSSEHRLKAILNKLGEYEDAERKGLLLRLPCEEVNGMESKWIPATERLPEEAYGCLVTVMDYEPSTQTDFENILPYFVGYDGHGWNDADEEKIPFEVIAWMPLPEPYRESEDKDAEV